MGQVPGLVCAPIVASVVNCIPLVIPASFLPLSSHNFRNITPCSLAARSFNPFPLCLLPHPSATPPIVSAAYSLTGGRRIARVQYLQGPTSTGTWRTYPATLAATISLAPL